MNIASYGPSFERTDAAINRGCSGGPLLNSAGRVIGMTCAIASPSGSFAGIGFAIPIATVEPVVDEILSRGRASRPSLGIIFAPRSTSRHLGLDKGLLVLGTKKNGPAEKAGIRRTIVSSRNGEIALGDVIVSIDGTEVDSILDVWRVVARSKNVGDVVSLTVIRRGEGTLNVDVTLHDGAEEDDRLQQSSFFPFPLPRAKL